MLTRLAPYWKSLAVRGGVAVAFGLVALLWPQQTVAFLLMLFGVYILVDGGLATYAGLRMLKTRKDWWAQSLQGLVGIVMGCVIIFWPLRTAQVLIYAIAAWVLAIGLLQMLLAYLTRREISNEWSLGINGALSVVFGIVLLIIPSIIIGFLWVIALFAVIFGLLTLIFAFRLRAMDRAERLEQTMPPQMT